jgi:hypothetical protein
MSKGNFDAIAESPKQLSRFIKDGQGVMAMGSILGILPS